MSTATALRRAAPALAALLIATPALGDWRVSFREGVKASDQERWEEVVRHMQAAIEERPSDDKDKVSIFSNRFISYIPNAYLGMALAKLGRCEDALPYFDQADVQRVAPDREPDKYKPMLQERGRCINQLMAGATEAAEKALASAQRAATELSADAALAAVLDAEPDLGQRRQQALAQLQAANKGAVDAIQASHLPSLRQAVGLAQTAEQSFVALRRDAAVRRDSGASTTLRRAQQEATAAIASAGRARDDLAALRRQPAGEAAWRGDQGLARSEREASEQLAQAEALAGKTGASGDDLSRAVSLAERAAGGYDRVTSDLRARVSRGQRAEQEAGDLLRRLDGAITAAERSQNELSTARERPELRNHWSVTPTLGGREQQLAADLDTARRARQSSARDTAALRTAIDLATDADRGFQELTQHARSWSPGTAAPDVVVPPTPDPRGDRQAAPAAAPTAPPPALRDAVDAYFRGEYARALELLEELDTPAFAVPRVMAQAHLFRAAASFAMYSLDGDEARRRAAVESIGRAKAAEPSLQPSTRYFPPPFLELFQTGG